MRLMPKRKNKSEIHWIKPHAIDVSLMVDPATGDRRIALQMVCDSAHGTYGIMMSEKKFQNLVDSLNKSRNFANE